MIPCLIEAEQPGFWEATASHRFASLFSSAPWQKAVARTYGFGISAAVHGPAGRPASALLFSRIADLRGERIVCGPFCDYCDPLVTEAAAWRAVLEPLLALRLPVTLRCLHNAELAQLASGFQVAGRAAWHGVDLTPSEAELWSGFDSSARQNVRKAQRMGVTVRARHDMDAVRAFFDMHCHVRKTKYRLLPQPFALFEQIHAAFAPERRLTVLLVEDGSSTLAGILFLAWGDTLYYKFNASVDRQACPNDLLMWEGIRLGQRLGLRRLDLGASDYAQPGLLRYKAKYATEQREILRLRWTPPEHADPRAEEAGRLLAHMTQLLTDPSVPDGITRAAGEALYAQFC